MSDVTTTDLPVVAASGELVIGHHELADARRAQFESLTGQQKVAIVLTQLPDETAILLFKTFGSKEAVLLASEIAKLPTLEEAVVRQVLQEFAERVGAARLVTQGGFAQAERIFAGAFGEEEAAAALAGIQGRVAVGPLSFISQVDAANVAPLLADEHPQTVAVILAHMPPDEGSKLLNAMPPELRVEVAERIAMMDRVSPEAIKIAAEQLARKLSGLGSAESSVPGGIPTLVDLLNWSEGSTEKQILTDLETRNPDVAEEVKKHMFTFEDVLALDDRSLQVVLRGVEIKDLAVAIKPSIEDPEIMIKINRNISERAQTELQEELGVMGGIRVSQVDAAQSNIVRAVRDLEASGEIVIARQTDELV
jgi:flagellar motor switch protein FliG